MYPEESGPLLGHAAACMFVRALDERRAKKNRSGCVTSKVHQFEREVFILWLEYCAAGTLNMTVRASREARVFLGAFTAYLESRSVPDTPSFLLECEHVTQRLAERIARNSALRIQKRLR